VVKLRCFVLALMVTRLALAEPAVPRVHHAPVSVAPAHEPLRIRADIEHPQLVKRAVVVYQTPDGKLHEVEFLRASEGPYVAEIPADQVMAPTLGYTIEIEPVTGQRLAGFASRADLHRVSVPEELMDLRERALSERLGQRRSVFFGSADWVSFGDSEARGGTDNVSDNYYRIEGGFTYRPLRLVTEFGVRAGVVRGTAPVPVRDLVPGQDESERYEVGLNYGAPTVRFRLHDQVHLDGELLISVTEVGFSWGGGAAVLLGDPYGSKLTLGFESVQVFGNRFYSRMDVVAFPGVTVAPVIEVTNMPSAEDYGVRLLGEVGFDLGQGWGIAARGGYQARNFTSGGPSAGATASYAF
jgi:hypothetical protein